MFNESSKGLKKGRMDWSLLFAAFTLLLMGTLAIVSSTVSLPMHDRILRIHFTAIPLAAAMFLFGWSFNYQIYQDQWKVVYGVVLAALVGVLLFGVTDRGSKSWFRLPFFSIQPAELCRIGLILVFANYLDKNSARIREPLVALKALALTMPVFFLVMKQPDFSSTLVTFPVMIAMLFCAGANIFHLLVILGYGFLAGFFPIAWTFISLNPDWLDSSRVLQAFYALSKFGLPTLYFCVGVAAFAYGFKWLAGKLRWRLPKIYFIGGALVIILGFLSGVWVQNQLKEYQRKRFEVFLSPEADPQGAGYNLLQAQVAIGSGGLLGKGVFSGTQTRLGFVPERHTDFILAVVGEETGFWGTGLVLGLYLLMLWRIRQAAQLARDQYGYLVACGLFSMFTIYLMINFGMSVGIMPVAGIPLPLLSYGGSNLVSTLWAVGIAESIYARRMALV